MEEVDIFDELFVKQEKAQREGEKVEATKPQENKEEGQEEPSTIRCDECGREGANYSPHYKQNMCINCWF